MLDFSFFDYLKFMHSPQLFDLIHFHSLLKACYQRFWKCKKPVVTDWLFPCSGDTTRTCDLRVMSPTSYQLLHPALLSIKTLFRMRCKDTYFLMKCKCLSQKDWQSDFKNLTIIIVCLKKTDLLRGK